MKTEQTESEIEPVPTAEERARERLEPVPYVKEFEVYCRLKKSSKYYHQGLVDPAKPRSAARFFKLESFIPPHNLRDHLWKGAYFLRFNHNQYRLEDCELFLRSTTDPEHYIRIR